MGRPSAGNVRKLPSGRYQARLQWPDKVRRSAPQTFLSKRDADEWLRAMHTDIVRAGKNWMALLAESEEPPGLTFEPYARAWIARREVRGEPIADWTRVRYTSLLEKHLVPAFGALPLASITREAVQQWYGQLLLNRPTTRRHAYGLLRSIMKTAARERLIPESPVDIEGAGSPGRRRAVRIATVEELDAIAEAMPERLRLSVLLGSWCAMRYGEVAELRRCDVLVREDGSMAIHVQRSVSWAISTTEPKVGPPKTDAGDRLVAVPPNIVPVVRHHLKTHAQWGRTGLLFPHPVSGKQIPQGIFYKSWHKARKAAGRPDLRFHDLRHTGLTLAARAGATVGELMLRAGHASPSAAMRYQQASAERDQQIAERLAAFASGEAAQQA